MTARTIFFSPILSLNSASMSSEPFFRFLSSLVGGFHIEVDKGSKFWRRIFHRTTPQVLAPSKLEIEQSFPTECENQLKE